MAAWIPQRPYEGILARLWPLPAESGSLTLWLSPSVPLKLVDMGTLFTIMMAGVAAVALAALWLQRRRSGTPADPSAPAGISRPAPPLQEQYFLSTDSLDHDQLRFFHYLVGELEFGRTPPVDGQFGYLLLYAEYLLLTRPRAGLREISRRLLSLCQAYSAEPKFVAPARMWAHDCLLALGEYEDFLRQSEPTELFVTDTHRSNLRCNVAHHLGRDAAPIDLFRMASHPVTAFTRGRPEQFRGLLDQVFTESNGESDSWLNRLIAAGKCERIYRHSLFQGCGVPGPELPFRTYCFYMGVEILREPIREAEQRLRDLCSVPRIGEGWVTETELFHTLQAAFPQTTVLHHGKIKWLGLQHFDIWFPEWNFAVEYHGAQHFEPVEFFGGREAFLATRERDERKAGLCLENGVVLIIASEGIQPEAVVERIKELRKAPAGGRIVALRREDLRQE